MIEKDVRKGVEEGFNDAVSDDFIDKKIGTAVEVAGVTAEAEDLSGQVDKLRHKISIMKIAAIDTWILCGVVFIARFIIGGAL